MKRYYVKDQNDYLFHAFGLGIPKVPEKFSPKLDNAWEFTTPESAQAFIDEFPHLKLRIAAFIDGVEQMEESDEYRYEDGGDPESDATDSDLYANTIG